MTRGIKVSIFENELFFKLKEMLNCNFSNCYMSLKPFDKFYSPFILGLIGIFLIQTKQKKYQDFLNALEDKLNETPNSNGIYNFYGDENYFFDVDTTSIVNTFFLLRHSKSVAYHQNIINIISNNKKKGDKGIRTWLNKPINNIDWFVNYNFYTYTHIFKSPNNVIINYLLSEKVDFLKNGSFYYTSKDFPAFIVTFNQKEFNINLSFDELSLSVYGSNLFHIGLNILNDNKPEITFNTLQELSNTKQIYFNSKRGFYSSPELNAAILIYLNYKI